MKERGTITMAAGLAMLLGRSTALAATYHVAPGGDDAAVGSAARPFRTLQRAANQVKAGDTVRVAPGDYDGFSLENKAGTRERPIVFLAAPGARVVRPGPLPENLPLNVTHTTSWPKWPHGLYVWGSSHVRIEGFEVVGMPPAELDAKLGPVHRGGAGIFVQVSDHITLRRNRADDNGRWGIFTSFTDDLLVEDNECSRSRSEHGIYVSNSADRPIIRRNHVWGNQRSGIQINADNNFDSPAYRVRGGVVDGIVTGAVIEDNLIHDNGAGGGAAINLDGVQDSLIRRNILLDNHAWGVALYQIDGAEGSRRNRVLDNTILMADDARHAVQIASCEAPVSSTCPTGNRPPIPEWIRPPSRVTGSTGNVILRNTLLNANAERGSIRIDAVSLAADGGNGARFWSDFNRVVDRFAISTTPGFEGDRVLSLDEWRLVTGQDRCSHRSDVPGLPGVRRR
ncbi:right-handed parallel beta-helix repeat-containing protein [Polyangium sp. 15x6]|uniref:right-handed parallel beta-helix repeat-containing protein n=1 Tax=Polyangium sp. 15x6 TaxID=3042687 RepID=UPI00249C60C7|nr:right-handed parallel beta-helix repeat-containing protein [Polyangium sp. 15x6]MDI3285587.1 right-handed parallel beta-helix repeat-containing protein [Polyangium sp. 15x6]